nr:MAG TPA: hypothetical protein [Caudoviricetes sp.]
MNQLFKVEPIIKNFPPGKNERLARYQGGGVF